MFRLTLGLYFLYAFSLALGSTDQGIDETKPEVSQKDPTSNTFDERFKRGIGDGVAPNPPSIGNGVNGQNSGYGGIGHGAQPNSGTGIGQGATPNGGIGHGAQPNSGTGIGQGATPNGNGAGIGSGTEVEHKHKHHHHHRDHQPKIGDGVRARRYVK